MKMLYSVLCVVAAALFTVVMFYYNPTIGTAQACAVLALCVAALVVFVLKTKNMRDTVRRASMYFENRGKTDTIPMPLLVCDKDRTVVWYNNLFDEYVLRDSQVRKDDISEFTGDIDLSVLCAAEFGTNIAYNNRNYIVFAEQTSDDSETYCLFFVDNTELKHIADEYKATRPVVFQMKIDNLEEVYQSYRNSECEVISGELEKILEGWAAAGQNVFRRIGSGKYIMVTDERRLNKVIANKFEILKRIRDFKYGENPVEITLSVGVGVGGNLTECDEFSKQALEMSQSRGGDQATVNNNGNLEFYGGTVSGSTKRTKIKARLIANAFADHVENADVVFVMGHCFSDLDSVGSAVGVYSIVNSMKKPCYILVDKEKSMAKNLIEQLDEAAIPGVFSDNSNTEDLITSRSLLVVVDTHRAESLEYAELFPSFENVVVIDHHRRTANYISNAVLYYDEPNASSACELVTEMLQYVPTRVDLHPMCADALLSGIMLDTRNFVLSTGARTFEAAAYLKGIGANTVSVKQLFANNFENYKQKNAIVSTAVTYKGCAVAVATEYSKDIRIIASQVADELLNVSGVKSSYVLFEENDQINISARSLGEMNVQVIMEHLGGGGHLTMAATQLSDITMGDAVIKLEESINRYIEETE